MLYYPCPNCPVLSAIPSGRKSMLEIILELCYCAMPHMLELRKNERKCEELVRKWKGT